MLVVSCHADIGHNSLLDSFGFGKLAGVAVLQMTTKCKLLVVSLPLFWGQTCRDRTHIWVCLWKTSMALSTREITSARRPQPGQPDTCTDSARRVGIFTLLACGTAVCLRVHVCLFCRQTLPSCPLLSGVVSPLASVPTQPKEIRWELPLMFSTGFPWGKSKCFLGIKWALRSAEVLRKAENGFLKCSCMVVRRIYFYLPCVCTEASMHDFLLFLESFKHMVNRLSMGWNLLLQEMLLQIVFPLQCIEGFSCHPQHMLWNPSGLQKAVAKSFQGVMKLIRPAERVVKAAQNISECRKAGAVTQNAVKPCFLN